MVSFFFFFKYTDTPRVIKMPSALVCVRETYLKREENAHRSLCMRLLGTNTFRIWTYNRMTILGVS